MPTLAQLCRYYLECLSREDMDISVYASSNFQLDYVQLPSMPLVGKQDLISQLAVAVALACWRAMRRKEWREQRKDLGLW